MQQTRRSSCFVIIPLLCLLVAPAAVAQSGRYGPFDPKSGRFGGAIPNEPAHAPDTLSMTQQKAWEALPALFAKLGVAISVVDTESHVLGALRVPQRRMVAGERLSRLLECGTGSFGPNADRYSVNLTVLVSVQSLPDGQAVIETRVGGVAAPNGLNSSVNCASTGVLEDRITAELRTLAAH